MKRTELKNLRLSNGFTQEEMAEKCGCSRVTYCKVENGECDPHPRFWKKFKKVFKISEDKMKIYQQKGGTTPNEK